MPELLRRQGVKANICVSNTISNNSLSINNSLRIRISIRVRNINTSSKVQPRVSNDKETSNRVPAIRGLYSKVLLSKEAPKGLDATTVVTMGIWYGNV